MSVPPRKQSLRFRSADLAEESTVSGLAVRRLRGLAALSTANTASSRRTLLAKVNVIMSLSSVQERCRHITVRLEFDQQIFDHRFAKTSAPGNSTC
jgi:hypothetical protein